MILHLQSLTRVFYASPCEVVIPSRCKALPPFEKEIYNARIDLQKERLNDEENESNNIKMAARHNKNTP